MINDYYKKIDSARRLLKLNEEASLEEIKTAYRRLAQKYHPDKCPEKKKKICEGKFRKVTQAKDDILEYCMQYKISFKKDDVSKKKLNLDIMQGYQKRFYDNWMFDL